MGLLDTLKQIKEDGFNPETDRVATNSKLEAGKYAMRLKSAQTNTDKAGRAQIGIALEVTSGQHKDRLEILYISFDEGLPPFVLEKNGRTLLKLAAMAGVTFTNKDLADEYSASEALAKGIGNQFNMDLTISPNKKNPDYPYRNYDFSPLAASEDFPFDTADMEIPF